MCLGLKVELYVDGEYGGVFFGIVGVDLYGVGVFVVKLFYYCGFELFV